MTEELSKRVMERFSEQLRSRAEDDGSLGDVPGSVSGMRVGGSQPDASDPRNSRLPASFGEENSAAQSRGGALAPTSWARCRQCGPVEVPRGDHPRAGRCPTCGRNV